jgi:hypothetical protein
MKLPYGIGKPKLNSQIEMDLNTTNNLSSQKHLSIGPSVSDS